MNKESDEDGSPNDEKYGKDFWLSMLMLNLTNALLMAEQSSSTRIRLANHVKEVIRKEEKKGYDDFWLKQMKDIKNWADKIINMEIKNEKID